MGFKAGVAQGFPQEDKGLPGLATFDLFILGAWLRRAEASPHDLTRC